MVVFCIVTPDGWPVAAAGAGPATIGICRIFPLVLTDAGNLRLGAPCFPEMIFCWMGRLMCEAGVTLTASGWV